MANVLGQLFGDIADAIRGKTGEAGTMKPAEFPDKIAAIETGGGSSGGASGEWLIASGATTETTEGKINVTHDLGVVPDIVYIIANASGSSLTGGENKLRVVAGCMLSSKLLGDAGADEKTYGYCFLINSSSGGPMIGTLTVGLENVTTSAFAPACGITARTMQIGTDAATLFPGKTYNWVAMAMK